MKTVGKYYVFKCSEEGNQLNTFNGLKCRVICKLGDFDFNDEEDSVTE